MSEEHMMNARTIADVDKDIEAASKTLRKLRLERQTIAHGGLTVLKAAYSAGEVTVGALASTFGMSRGKLTRLIIENDWPRRLPVQSRSQKARRAREATA